MISTAIQQENIIPVVLQQSDPIVSTITTSHSDLSLDNLLTTITVIVEEALSTASIGINDSSTTTQIIPDTLTSTIVLSSLPQKDTLLTTPSIALISSISPSTSSVLTTTIDSTTFIPTGDVTIINTKEEKSVRIDAENPEYIYRGTAIKNSNEDDQKWVLSLIIVNNNNEVSVKYAEGLHKWSDRTLVNYN